MRGRVPRAGISFVVPLRATARETILRTRTILRYAPPDREVILAGTRPAAQEFERLQTFARSQPDVLLYLTDTSIPLGLLLNRAAARAGRAHLALMSDSITLRRDSTQLLKRMATQASKPNTGVVGCLLLSPKKMIIQAGLYRRAAEPIQALYAGAPLKIASRRLGSRSFPYDVRKTRAVLATAGIGVIQRTTFKSLQGFHAGTDLPFDRLLIGLCLTGNDAGRQTWYVGGSSLRCEMSLDQLQPPGALSADTVDSYAPEAPAVRPIRPTLMQALRDYMRGRR